MIVGLSHRAADLAGHLGLRTGRPRSIGLALVGLALVSGTVALELFPERQVEAWPFYVASVATFMAASHVLLEPQGPLPRPRGAVIAWGLLILAIAAFFRFYRFDTLPYGTWWDEADNGMAALRILRDPRYRPIYVESTNLPAHFIYLVALAFQWFGVSTQSIRLVTAAFGLATVVAAFFVGREAHGSRFGLILAFLFAVARWNVNFSRLGLHGISTPFFILLATLWMLRARRTGRLTDFAWAGTTIGAALCFYAANRLFMVVVAAFVVYWSVSWWRTSPRPAGHGVRYAANLLVFVLATGLVLAPVAQFALRSPAVFWNRANQISLWTNRDEPDLGRAIAANTVKHLLMFNFRGDANGRHNLPGEPMLDPLSGVLAVVGLGLALSRPRNLAATLFLLSFITGLSGGILAVDFEAPQSLRAIGAMPAALYFVALAAETFWRALDRVSLARAIRQGGYAALAIGVGGLTLYLNAHTYFVRQANNDGVWEAYNAVETSAARRMLALGPEATTFYISMFFNNHLVTQFLAPQVRDSRTLLPPDVLPIREPGDRPVALLVDAENAWIAEAARQYYPGAQYLVDTTPGGSPVLYTVVISPDQIRSIQGLTARYWRGDLATGEPALVRHENGVDSTWPGEAPLGSPFVAEWSGVLFVPRYGDYDLLLESPGGATVWIDETVALSGPAEQGLTIPLAQGNHALRVQAASGAGRVRLAWRPAAGISQAGYATIPSESLYLSPPASNHGLIGAYYQGPGWVEPPAFARVDPFVDMYFHIIPLGRPYTVEWSGQVEAPSAGEYAFGLQVTGSAQLFIDDQLVVDALAPGSYVEGEPIRLSAGNHKLRLRFLDDVARSEIHLYWTPPDATERQIVPSSALWPYP